MLTEYIIFNVLCVISALADDAVQNQVTTEDYIPCEKGWFLFKEKCYKVGGKKPSGRLYWKDASNSCKEEGAMLATIYDKDINDFIVTFLLLDVKNSVWIGLHDLVNESIYSWEDGTPFEYAKWEPNEPSGPNREHEDCVQMVFNSWGTIGRWNDNTCDIKLPYICQKEKSRNKKTRDPRFCPGSGTAWKYQSSCYSIVTEKMSWEDAEKHCHEKFQGHLVMVTDFTVDMFLDHILSNFNKDIWIGIKIQNQFQQKWTSDFFVAYSDWTEDQVDFTEGTCVLRSKSRVWTTVPCSKKYSFICEKSNARPPVLPDSVEDSRCPDLTEETIDNHWRDLGGDYCYFFNTTAKLNWYQANFECMRRGGSLVSIHSSAENQTLFPFVRYTQHTLFIGLYRLVSHEDVFVWADGSHLDFKNWNIANGEPNGDKEHCVELYTSSMLWNDCMCEEKKGYICSIKKVSPNITEIDARLDCPSGISLNALIGVSVCILLLVILLAVVIYYLKCGEKQRKKSKNFQPSVPNSERPRYRSSELALKDDDYYENMN